MKTNAYETFLRQGGELLPASLCIMTEPIKRTTEWAAVWIHEYFHFLQLTGTKFGRQLVFMYANIGHSTGAFLREPSKRMLDASVWYFPIFYWCQFEPNLGIRDDLRKHWAFAFNTMELFKLGLGIQPVGARNNRWPKQKLWNHSAKAPRDTILPEFSLSKWPQSYNAPSLRTLDVMESAAAIQGLRMMSETRWRGVSTVFGLTSEQRNSLDSMHYKYSAALRYVEECTQIEPCLAPAVCVLAADIAMDSGIEDLMGSEKVAWEDWYPGWRFVKAVKAIEDLISREFWPEDEDGLSEYYDIIRTICGWKHTKETADSKLFHIFQHNPSPADLVRQEFFALAEEHRGSHFSLWSIGPRDDLLDASLDWFRPPLAAEFGSNTLKAWNQSLDESGMASLWRDTQLNHVAYQLLADADIAHRRKMGIQCFDQAKAGILNPCKQADSCCHYFPSDSLPRECTLREVIKQLAGGYWSRLRPIFI
jgi:hypothetical protein